jgi:Domain of unknown function (DUF1707)
VTAGNEMRVSDTEREAAAAELQEHFASGRLNQDELNERLTAVFAAKTRGDLNALFTDLPSSGHGWASAGASGAAFGSSRPFGSGGAWTQSISSDSDADWQAGGNAGRSSAGSTFGRLAFSTLLIWALFIFGLLGIFGIGAGRPFGIVLLLAAFALLRRLLFIFFGRRRARRGKGPRRRR